MGKTMRSMTKNEKISWLQQYAWEPYVKAKAKAEKELDDMTLLFCFCGKLATGFHRSHCKKFQERLKTKIIDELKDLIPKT